MMRMFFCCVMLSLQELGPAPATPSGWVVEYCATPPVMTLIGPSEMTIVVGKTPFYDPGASYRDRCLQRADGGWVQWPVMASGLVDVKRPGNYWTHYVGLDYRGNVGGPLHRKWIVKAGS
jgi:hypothetical protein